MTDPKRASLLALVDELHAFNVEFHSRDQTRRQLVNWADRLTALVTPDELTALHRPYRLGEETCALCGNKGQILYQHLGGWWCYAHQSIPEREFLKQQRPLLQGIQEFIDYHS
jgi:hypothetical protein